MNDKSDLYLTIRSTSEGFYKEKGSKFFAFAYPCDNRDEAMSSIEKLRKEHHNAVHVCFAWRFGTSEPFEDRFSDDGEPNNSAGKPIFGQILSFGITNVLIAVVRYYGGTNLGVGGLINAYRTASQQALENAEIVKEYIAETFKLIYEYRLTGDVMQILDRSGATIIEQGFESNRPTISFSIRRSKANFIITEFEKYPDISLTQTNSE